MMMILRRKGSKLGDLYNANFYKYSSFYHSERSGQESPKYVFYGAIYISLLLT